LYKTTIRFKRKNLPQIAISRHHIDYYRY